MIAQHFDIAGEADFLKLKILDVGCGGGLVSVPMAKAGAQVSALDGGRANLEAAKQYAQNNKIENINFIHSSVEDYADYSTKYDVIISCELIEHLDNPLSLINLIDRLLDKSGMVIISTLNKSYLSWFLSIFVAENIARIIPKNTHQYDKLICPAQIQETFGDKFLIRNLKGLSFLPIKGWHMSNFIQANYILYATRR